MTVAELLELIAIALAIAAVIVATHLVWAGLLAGAGAAGYLSHGWEWDGAAVPRPRLRRAKAPDAPES